MLLIRALGSQARAYLAAALAVIEAVVLSLTGFRGAAASFVVAIIFAATLVMPKSSPWRRPHRAALAATVLALVALIGFIAGANVRNVITTQLGAGTQLFSPDEALSTVSARLDLGPPLQKAIQYQNDSSVDQALSWSTQIQAFIPRFFWQDKPIVDYGQQVSVTVYGLRYGESSSTISTVGDVLVNFKIPGVIILSLLLGLALSLGERQIRKGVGLVSIVLAAVLSYGIVGQEAPLIVTVAGIIRNVLVAAILWRASQAVYGIVNAKQVPSVESP
jgi:hypothetical protein